jgi:hypothetical protein
LCCFLCGCCWRMSHACCRSAAVRNCRSAHVSTTAEALMSSPHIHIATHERNIKSSHSATVEANNDSAPYGGQLAIWLTRKQEKPYGGQLAIWLTRTQEQPSTPDPRVVGQSGVGPSDDRGRMPGGARLPGVVTCLWNERCMTESDPSARPQSHKLPCVNIGSIQDGSCMGIQVTGTDRH